MRSFKEFLTEKFFDGYEGHGYMGYTEVWINPTSNEVAEAAGKRQIKVDANFSGAPGTTAYYCRGWVTDKQLFIWSASSDDHMNVEQAVQKSAREQKISVNFSNALAVELWYFPSNRTVGLHMAAWNNPGRLTDTQAVEKVKNHPAIKSLIGPSGKVIPVDVK
jgi:hypothetical protein